MMPRGCQHQRWVSREQKMPAFSTFDSTEVSELVGIGPVLLNKFVERGMYGIRPSVRRGKGRGGRRLFSPDDVFGIALVWWLFESGLRSNVIQVVLDQICETKSAGADQAAKRLMLRKTPIVSIRTQPRRMDPRFKRARYDVRLITEGELEKAGIALEMKIPVGHFYSMLLDKMKKLTGLPEGE